MAVTSGASPPSPQEEALDATRRTWLANERTWLAWVRTGLTATAVALALGKVVPELAKAHTRWPYVAIGVGYAVLGVALTSYGFQRRREVEHAVNAKTYAPPNPRAIAVFAAATFVLGAATVAVVALA
jgi:putative membrane protein